MIPGTQEAVKEEQQRTMYIVHIRSTAQSFISDFYSMHLLLPLLITVAKIPPVVYYHLKDVATYLSRSRSLTSSVIVRPLSRIMTMGGVPMGKMRNCGR